MVDHFRQKMILIAGLFLTAYILSTSLTVPASNHSASSKLEDSTASDPPHNYTTTEEEEEEEDKKAGARVFEGRWAVRGEGKVFGRMERKQGLVYLQRREKGSGEEFENTALMYDGLWESDEIYTLRFGNSSILSPDCWKPRASISAGVFTRYGFLQELQNITGNVSLVNTEGEIVGNMSMHGGVTLDFRVRELTAEMRKQPRVTYSFIISLLSTLQIFAFVKHSQESLNSEQQAKKVLFTQTSKMFLFANVVMDATLSIWHLGLAFEELEAFDYLILAAFWNFASFLLLQSRAIAIIWRAHYEGGETVRGRQTFDGIRHQYSLFYTKLCIFVVLSLICLFSMDCLSYWGVALLSWFFVPQIIVSAAYGYRNALKPVVYVPLGLSRIIFILYIFGCPANFLRREPDYPLCAGLSSFILVQMCLIHAQNSRLGPKFFVPRALRKAVYSYYRKVEDEVNIEDVSDK